MTRPGYKMTEIGEIPEEWEVVNMGDNKVSEIVMGQSPPSSFYNTSGEGMPFLQGNADFGEIYPSRSIYCTKPLKIAEKGDILLSVRAPVGELNISAFKCIIGRGLAAIRCKDKKTHSKYLYYYLKFTVNRLRSLSTGSTFKAVGKDTLSYFEICLPDFEEQQKIAEILSTADEAIQRVNDQIIKTERLKKGLMQTLFTNGIGHTEFKMTEIGEIPEEWEISKLSKIFRVFTGTTPSTKIGKYWSNGNIEWLTPKDLGQMADALVIPSSEKKITPEAFKESGLNLIPEESILISTRAPVGYVGINKEEITFNQGCKGLVPIERESTNSSFYAYYLKYRRNYLVLASSGSTFKELSKERLASLDVPIPPLPEQQKITDILTTVDDELKLLRNNREHMEKLKKGLMGDLLTGRVRVNVNGTKGEN